MSLEKFIKIFFSHSKKIYHEQSSYSLKHDYEHITGKYVSNDEFKQSMENLYFEGYIFDVKSTRMKLASLKEIQSENDNLYYKIKIKSYPTDDELKFYKEVFKNVK